AVWLAAAGRRARGGAPDSADLPVTIRSVDGRRRRILSTIAVIAAIAFPSAAAAQESAASSRLPESRPSRGGVFLVDAAAPAGLPADDVERAVAAPLERLIARIPGVERMVSRSYEGASLIEVAMNPGVARAAAFEAVAAATRGAM